MKRTIILVSLCLGAGQAMAGGPSAVATEPPVAPMVAPAGFDWTGFYVGGSVGSGTMSDSSSDYDYDHLGLQAGYLRDFGTTVLGGELAYAKGDFDTPPGSDFSSTRLKLIGGLGSGSVLPYLFAGLSNIEINNPGSSFSDTAMIYGLGARFALGQSQRHVIGLEYLVETKDNFDGTGEDIDTSEFSLRYDFRF